MTDEHRQDAGPYVLGALPPEDRRAFEEHLETCPACQAEVRGFAGLPGLLSRLPAGDLPTVLEGGAEPAAPVSVLPALLSRARGERRSRARRALLVGAAAACVAAAGGAAVTGAVQRPDAPAAAAVAFARTSAEVPASAEATLTDVPGGTRIDMTCRYTGAVDGRDREYVLQVVPKGGGASSRLASWPVLTADDYRLVVVAPLPRGGIDVVEVTNATGRSLLTLHP